MDRIVLNVLYFKADSGCQRQEGLLKLLVCAFDLLSFFCWIALKKVFKKFVLHEKSGPGVG